MNHLPDELHIAIAHCLSPTDLVSYRLTSKRFSNISANLIFSVLSLNAYPDSLRCLNEMFGNTQKDFKRHIHTLNFDYKPKPDLVPGDQLEGGGVHWLPSPRPSASKMLELWGASYAASCVMYTTQAV